MSRSYKYHSFDTWCYGSNKKDKVTVNRRFRRLNKLRVKSDREPLYKLNEISDTWNFNTDGLAFYISKKDYFQHHKWLESIGNSYIKDIQNSWRKILSK